MRHPELHDAAEFPANGFRARRWLRFERDLDSWLGTAEGRFATWWARRQIAGESLRPAAETSGSVRRDT